MRSSMLFVMLLSVVGASLGAFQNSGPVYRAAPMNAPVIKNSQGPPQQVMSVPVQAEERESPAFNHQQQQPLQNVEPTKAPAAANPVTQSYMVWYYPNSPAQQTGYQNTGVSDDYLSWFKMGDVGAGVASLALIGLGVGILYPKFASVRSRALRALQEYDANDATTLAKNVFKAIQRYNDASIETE